MDFLITGVTGFLGSHFLARCLTNDSAEHLYALARSGNTTAARRVDAALTAAATAPLDGGGRLEIVESDIMHPLCGLADAQIARIKATNRRLAVWHMAASLNWEPGKRATIFGSNVDGTRNALELASQLGADTFVYVSTAYTCGSLDGRIPEAIHAGVPRFNNLYEESKHAAETAVRQHCEARGLRYLILRPSIIVGTSHDYKASGSYTGLYGFIREVKRFKKMLGDSQDVVRYSANRETVLSFIPVDHVVTDMLAIFAAETDQPKRPVYHVTAQLDDASPTLGELTDYVFEKCGVAGRIRFVDEELGDISPLERFFAKRMSFFSGYLHSTKQFERSIHSKRFLATEAVKRFIDSEFNHDQP
jgi:nucleoside-diphosphate-sugar epimerase